VADVFDALTSDRVYRPAFPARLAIDKMQAERGCHFDPELLDAFLAALPEVESIRRAYSG
jgi:putative two-component system response regulator